MFLDQDKHVLELGMYLTQCKNKKQVLLKTKLGSKQRLENKSRIVNVNQAEITCQQRSHNGGCGLGILNSGCIMEDG